MSQFGNLKHIADLETLLGWSLSNINFSNITDEIINYSWGDEKELVKWIHYKDVKTQNSGNLYTISGDVNFPICKRKKYPLVWLNTPVTGNNRNDIKEFSNVQIIVCSNTTEEWLNSTRWTKHIPQLQAIADSIIENLRGAVSIKRDNGILNYNYRTIPNYSVVDESKAIDNWDAVVINTDLLINTNCRDESYFNFCNK
jgi:hypothetical protein